MGLSRTIVLLTVRVCTTMMGWMGNDSAGGLLFEVFTPLNFTVRVSSGYWNIIATIKHPIMAGQDVGVYETLARPDEVRRSLSDDSVFLFYRKQGRRRWLCAVAKRLNGEGFLVTAYPTDAIKEGMKVWPT